MYYLLLFILYPISLLPLSMLYLLSDFAYLLLYKIFGYRKDIVRTNLTAAFPEKNEVEIGIIMNQFYSSFCDQWIETLKLLSMPMQQLDKRFKGNWELMEQLNAEGKNAYVMLGHFYNWEWGSVISQYHFRQQFAGIYLPLSSKPFDRLMNKIRTRSGAWLISMKNLKEGLLKLQGQRYVLGFIADQNPSVVETAAWITFMNRPAPFFRGPETMARKAKGAVVFCAIRKIKRGHYQLYFDKHLDDASVAKAGEITSAYATFIERELQRDPSNWLWSHRRWKHKQPS